MDGVKWIGGVLVLGLEAALMGAGGCAGGGAGTPIQPDKSSAARERGILLRTVAAERRDNRYAVYVPPNLDLGAPAPAIVFLHGAGECGADGLRQLTVGLLPAALGNDAVWGQFIIILPQKPRVEDSWSRHEELVLACLDATTRECGIDPARVYLTGLSQGGAGTWAIAADHPELFAAIAPVCGFVGNPRKPPSEDDAAARSRIAASLAAAKMPVWAFHGEKDDVVRPEQMRELIGALTTAGWTGDVRATYYAEANHNSWDKAYRDDGPALAKWFLSRVSSVSEAGAKR
ncbi:MAG: prolyl oligopeptidase family serine peptidase [Phycisphaerales bacterium]|nr:prolyl oligopeptidase family serine peptidase [Phycisphaerales bacterium]